jgi:hypothetical protein
LYSVGSQFPLDHACSRWGASVALEAESALLRLSGRLEGVEEPVVRVGFVCVSDAEAGRFVGADARARKAQ